ncbi:MAG: hypothetical protein Q8Q14_01850 [Gemmatimonadales bacterium]|nr:hypothetical protein [Gemmatimonadales bacterium]
MTDSAVQWPAPAGATRVKARTAAAAELSRTEKQLERQVKQLFQQFGWVYYHTFRSQFSPSGFPDCHAIHVEQRRVIYVELKRTLKDTLRPEQEVYRDALLAVGAEWYLWTWATPPEEMAAIMLRRPTPCPRQTLPALLDEVARLGGMVQELEGALAECRHDEDDLAEALLWREVVIDVAGEPHALAARDIARRALAARG